VVCASPSPPKSGLQEQVSETSVMTVNCGKLQVQRFRYLNICTGSVCGLQSVPNYLMCNLSEDEEKLLCEVRRC